MNRWFGNRIDFPSILASILDAFSMILASLFQYFFGINFTMDFCHDLARDWARPGGQLEPKRRPTAPEGHQNYEKVVGWSDLDG